MLIKQGIISNSLPLASLSCQKTPSLQEPPIDRFSFRLPQKRLWVTNEFMQRQPLVGDSLPEAKGRLRKLLGKILLANEKNHVVGFFFFS